MPATPSSNKTLQAKAPKVRYALVILNPIVFDKEMQLRGNMALQTWLAESGWRLMTVRPRAARIMQWRNRPSVEVIGLDQISQADKARIEKLCQEQGHE